MTTAVPIVVERENVNDEFVILVRWFMRHGEQVEVDALLAEVETSKANIEIRAPAAGFLVQDFPTGAEVPASSAIGHIVQSAPTTGAPTSESSASSDCSLASPEESQPNSRGISPSKSLADDLSSAELEFRMTSEYRQRISPLAARMMEAHGLTASDFAGKSVVRKQDVLDFLNPPAEVERPAQGPQAARSSITQPYREIPLSKMKRRECATLAGGMCHSLSSSVSVTCFTRGLKRALQARMPEGSASAVVLYEVSRLLRKYPTFNATWGVGTMLQYEQVNIGYAMDDGRGLKAAVVPQCDKLSLHEVAAYLRELTVAYVEDKLTPTQMADATFTVSDLSGMGVSSFLPLISENQGAILGIASEQFPPGTESGSYTLTLTFDHQLSDGRTAALLLNDLKSRLQGYEVTGPEAAREFACSLCGRTQAQLSTSNNYLLRSALPEGHLCTLCAAGY